MILTYYYWGWGRAPNRLSKVTTQTHFKCTPHNKSIPNSPTARMEPVTSH